MKVAFLHHQVDASHLIHELYAVRKHDSPASLDLVTLENVTPSVLAVSALQLDSFDDILLLSRNHFAVGVAIPNFAQDLQCLVVLAMSVQPARRLGDAEHKNDHDLWQSQLCSGRIEYGIPLLTNAKKTWQAIGTRHATDPGTKLIP
jgi:hypothetical protein